MHFDADHFGKSSDDDSNQQQWAAIVKQMESSIPDLVDEFVSRVKSIDSYGSGAIADDDLRQAATESLTLVIQSLADSEKYARVQNFARDLGELRAQQGIPSEALTSAVRLNFPVIWSALLDIADTSYMPLLAKRVESVWRVLDDYAVACYSAYVATRIREARLEVRVQQEFISEVLTPKGSLPEVQERFSRVFHAPIGDPYIVLAISGRSTSTMRTAGKEELVFLHEGPTYSVLFWPESLTPGNDLVSCAREIYNAPCGLARSRTGLAGLHDAAQIATILADHLTADDYSPLTIEANWPRLARYHFREIGLRPSGDFETLATGLQSGEAERIHSTVKRFLLTGSVSETAKQMFTHRNTVLNRLRKYSEVTGLDLRLPAQSARAVVELLG